MRKNKYKIQTFCYFLFLILTSLNAQIDSSQQFTAVKDSMFNFLNEQGILEKLNSIEEYNKRTYSYELVKKSIIGEDTCGIYGFGVHTSHTKTYILIIDNLYFIILDPDKLSNTILECLKILNEKNSSENLVSKYMEAILDIYGRNQNIGEGVLKINNSTTPPADVGLHPSHNKKE
jgi:hypothetical protein